MHKDKIVIPNENILFEHRNYTLVFSSLKQVIS